MDRRQVPSFPRLLALVLLGVGVFGLVFWLLNAPPAGFAPYQPWLRLTLSLFFGLWFLSCGLFFYSPFATNIGTGPNSPMTRWIGPRMTRLFFTIMGLFFLLLGVVWPLAELFRR